MDMLAIDGKKTEPIKVWVTPELELALRRLADEDHRKLSPYVELILRRHVHSVLGPDALGQEKE